MRDFEGETRKDYPPKSARRPHELTYIKRTDDKGLKNGAVNQIGIDEEPWGEIVPAYELYRDGTFNLSFSGPFSFLTEGIVRLFGEEFFDDIDQALIAGVGGLDENAVPVPEAATSPEA